MLSYINVKREKEPYKKENSVHSGEIKALADGVIIDTGELMNLILLQKQEMVLQTQDMMIQ